MRLSALSLLGLAACGSPSTPDTGAPVTAAPVTASPAGDADVTLVYSSRLEGELEPCG